MAFDFSKLAELARHMGAERVQWTIQAKLSEVPDWANQLKTTGIEIDISQIQIGPGKLLTLENQKTGEKQQVLLHIKDIPQSPSKLERGETSYRFHFAECRTLENMRKDGRFDRYVASQRLDGLFLVHGKDRLSEEERDVEAPLPVCQNCLTTVNYQGFTGKSPAEKKKAQHQFEIPEFFEHFQSLFAGLPRYTDKNAPVSYSPDWKEVSEKYRRHVGWRCEKDCCRVVLKEHKNLLHVHHLSGVKGDNRFENLKALCVVCHAEEHGRSMHVTLAAEKLIQKLRADQRR
jgi:hypothetical protein